MVICIWSKHKNKSYMINFKTNPCSKFQSITTPSSWKFSHFSLSLFQFPTKWKNYRITKSVTYKRYCCYNVQRMLPRNMDRELVVFSNILLNNNNNNNKSLNFKMKKMRSSRGLLFRLIDWQCSVYTNLPRNKFGSTTFATRSFIVTSLKCCVDDVKSCRGK